MQVDAFVQTSQLDEQPTQEPDDRKYPIAHCEQVVEFVQVKQFAGQRSQT